MKTPGRQKLADKARRTFCRVPLLLFALHAILPTGFMPDVGAIKDGRFEIVICTGVGTATLLVDQSGQRVPPAPSDTPGKHAGVYACPFGAAANKASAVSVSTDVSYRYFANAAHIVAATIAEPLPSRAHPPIGSRAPPSPLG